MEIEVITAGPSVTVAVSGDIDSETAPILEQRIAQLIGGGTTALIIDLDNVSFVSSAGLSVLLTAHRDADQLELKRGNRIVDRLVELTGLQMLYGTSP
jgi:anti-sigma B factor antagonist